MSTTIIKETIKTALAKFENQHESVLEYYKGNPPIDIECEVGQYNQYFGIEYFIKHGLTVNSSFDQIKEWMPIYHPYFNDDIIGKENNACSPAENGNKQNFVPDQIKLAIHRQIYKEAKSKRYDFAHTVQITQDGYLQYILYLVVHKSP